MSVSSKRPRCFKSLIRPAIAWSVSSAFFSWPAFKLPCWSQVPFDAPGGQKAARKILQAAARHDAEAKDDEARQIAILAAQAVTDPGAQARPARVVDARVQKENAGRVQRQVRFHGANHCDVVRTGGNLR